MNGFIEAVSSIPPHLQVRFPSPSILHGGEADRWFVGVWWYVMQRDESHVAGTIKQFYDRVDLLVRTSLKRGRRGEDERDGALSVLHSYSSFGRCVLMI